MVKDPTFVLIIILKIRHGVLPERQGECWVTYQKIFVSVMKSSLSQCWNPIKG